MASPLDEFVEIAERSIVRFEAEQVISGCLSQGDPAPFEELIQGLVINGPPSLLALREILDAVRALKAELSQEGLEIREDFMEALAGFGIFFPRLMVVEIRDLFHQICNFNLTDPKHQVTGVLDSHDEELLTEICSEASKRVYSIARRMAILSRFEISVLDWINGLAYEAAHTDWTRPETWQ